MVFHFGPDFHVSSDQHDPEFIGIMSAAEWFSFCVNRFKRWETSFTLPINFKRDIQGKFANGIYSHR